MTLYVDSIALLKRYIYEPNSDLAATLASDSRLITSQSQAARTLGLYVQGA